MKFRKITPEEIQKKKKSADEVRKMPRTPIYVIADNVRSLYNVGSIFRTCDGIMAKKLYLCGITGIPPRREIEKTSLGACDVVPWEYRENSADLVKELKKSGIKIVSLELTEPEEHFIEAIYSFPAAIVLGHEINGISDEIIELTDKAVKIPMLGMANSLNVASAFSAAAYQMLYQYNKNHAKT
jgi:tRNA G18 (ribose-2'-O)-methylase SpoU